MADLRWEPEMEEAMELVYQIRANHGGKLSESEAREQLGAWVTKVARRAEALSWLAIKGSPTLLAVTYGGRKALDMPIASKNAVPPPHWFGGSIPRVQSPTGPVLLPGPIELYQQLQEQAFREGILTQEDVNRIAHSPRREDRPEEPEEYRSLYESTFPGRRWSMISPNMRRTTR